LGRGSFDNEYHDLVFLPFLTRLIRAFTTCRATYFFSIPLDLKVREIKTIPLYLLPSTITLRWTDQINVILRLTLHQVIGFNLSGINQVFV
jgi:hypothetical protein